MNYLTLITCLFVVLHAASANPVGEEERQMVFVGMMDGFIVVDEDEMNSNPSKIPKPMAITNQKLPELINGSRPEMPEEKIPPTHSKLPGRPAKPTVIKLPPLTYAPQQRPYPYEYSIPKPYTAPGGYGSHFGYYGFRPSYPMMPPTPDYEFRPTYAMIPPRPMYGYRPSYPALPPRPIYGFQPYKKDESNTYDEDALLQYAVSD
ncbi:hypothetical protein GHT06_021811 [Daphnia sinensis]|uniref:Uncharacterized protein n=1 Tax=Daphnia sinensis TaxID=1820382 RepID=A0AAD5L5N2_9CRUS|nr:hypothetical protein GHT06_021811 [Daphnia sinensis]